MFFNYSNSCIAHAYSTPLIPTRSPSCPLCPYLHEADPCLLRGGPSTWNGLPSELRIFNRTTSPAFFSHLKTALFDRAGVVSASE